MSSTIQKIFKSNVVYELLIHGVYLYAGCHCSTKDSVYLSEIIYNSGNYLAGAMRKGLITLQEYKECVELVNVWEFDTKGEAQDFEVLKIQELKERYGDLCKNKALYGNQYGPKGVSRSKEYKKKMSESCKGRNTWSKGKHFSEEHRKKLSEAHKGKRLSEETKRKISEARLKSPKNKIQNNPC